MSTIGQSLRLSLARTLRRGAFWLDRLALRVTAAKPAGLVADDAPTGELPGPGSPPAHWLQRVRRPPPAHWLARIRQQAPHLLRGDTLAGTGWTRVIVPSPAAPVVDQPWRRTHVEPSTAGETSSPGRSGDDPEPAFTGQPPTARPRQRTAPLFAGRVLRLRQTQSPVLAAAGTTPATPAQESPTAHDAPWSGAPSASPATASPEAPATSTTKPALESPQWPALSAGAAVALPTGSANPSGQSLGSPGSRSAGSTPEFLTRYATGRRPEDDAAPPAGAPGPGTPSWPPAARAPESPNWPSVLPGETPYSGTADASPLVLASEAPHQRPANPRPDWRVAPPEGALAIGASDRPRAGMTSETPRARWMAPVSSWQVVAPEPARQASLPWPAVPDWPVAAEVEPNPDDLARQHLQRLDREQRGFLWNESPF